MLVLMMMIRYHHHPHVQYLFRKLCVWIQYVTQPLLSCLLPILMFQHFFKVSKVLFFFASFVCNSIAPNWFLTNLIKCIFSFLSNHPKTLPFCHHQFVTTSISRPTRRCTTQDDTESDSSSILNISFSARLSESLRDTESYFSPQFLQERVYLSRTLLTRLTDLEVRPRITRSKSTDWVNLQVSTHSLTNPTSHSLPAL